MQRLTDTRLYGHEYTVGNLLVELTDAVFADDLTGPAAATPRRQRIAITSAIASSAVSMRRGLEERLALDQSRGRLRCALAEGRAARGGDPLLQPEGSLVAP
jgi:hypothetical protein